MAENPYVIVGAGPAGVRAAETLVAHGIRPILIDEGARAGGQIYRQQPKNFKRSPATLYGSEAAKATAVHQTLETLRPSIDYRPDTLAWAISDGKIHVVCGDVSEAISYEALIIASGATDRIFPLPGWTLPGVYTLGASQISLKAQACAIGRKIVFMGSGPLLYLVAWQYLKAEAAPIAVLDTSATSARLRGLNKMFVRPGLVLQGFQYLRALRKAGVRLLSGITPLEFAGEDCVAAVRFKDAAGQEQSVDCDAVGFGYHLRAETQLADLAKVPFAYDAVLKQFMPICDRQGRTPVAGIYLAGDGVQLAGADAAEVTGKLAALAALSDRQRPIDATAVHTLLKQNARLRRFRDGIAEAFPWPGRRLSSALPDDTIICRCEEITVGTLRRTARELGAQEINRAKALNRVGMGRCQGRFCGIAAAEILASELGVAAAEVGRLRGQAPIKPLPLSVEIKP